ncbi:MAG TPA: hypothetical protein VE645_10245 [Pseudonocardiaceae bacterium]|nr:hypothetical protein [Pseudonocardiaceae bacterium]
MRATFASWTAALMASSGGTESGSKEHLEKTRHPRTVDNVEFDYAA